MIARLKFTSLVTATIAIFVLTGCDEDDNIFEKDRTNIATFGYDTDQQGIWFEVDDAPEIAVVTCTDYARLYAVERGGDRLLTSVYDLVNPWDGYYLDGEFVPPIISEGCDVLECRPATQDTFFVSNVEYKVVGVRAVPEGYADEFPEGWGEELPTDIPDVVSKIYEGPAHLVLYYYPGDECFSESDPSATTLSVFVSDNDVTPK